MLEFQDEAPDVYQVNIKVIGVGGGGCNAVKKMSDFNLEGVELIVANTDMQVLKTSPIKNKLQLGLETTRGMGAGSNPEVGRKAAEEDREVIREQITGANIVFIATGMGGGTGTGASPVIASVAREMGITTFAIVTRPFTYEGEERARIAEEGIKALKKEVDCLVIIPNDRILELMPPDQPLTESFSTVDDVLKNGVLSIARIAQEVGIVNVDMEDVNTATSERGIAMIGIGEASGENRAEEAMEAAISSPLIEKRSLDRAKGLLATITTSSKNLQTKEYQKIGQILQEKFKNAKTKTGVFEDESLGNTIRVTILATGIEDEQDYDEIDNPFATSSMGSSVPLEKEEDFLNATHEPLRVGKVGDEYMEEEGILKKMFSRFSGRKKGK